MHICGRLKEKEAERLFVAASLIMFINNISILSSKYRSQLSRSVSFTSLPFSSLQWFDVPNHFQPWTPHERQQALSVIGCWKNERGRERTEKRGDAKRKRGGQGRNGDWRKSYMKPRSSSFPFQGLMLSLALPFVPLPNYFPLTPTFPSLLSFPAIYLNCTHSASTHWQQKGRNWFGDLQNA